MEKHILGIDIGSVYLGIVLVNHRKEVLEYDYLPHQGKVEQILNNCLEKYDLWRISRIVCPSGHAWFTDRVVKTEYQTDLVRAARTYFPAVRSLLVVGAEKFLTITIGKEGWYQGATFSTSCAAGTGSFLDQQSSRLELNNIRELTKIALSNTYELPEIASRCAVFAKTDLIHAQQKGYSLSSICDSLTKGLARNIVDTLFGETPPVEPVVMAGGVALNKAVRQHLEKMLGVTVQVHKYSNLFAAVGACLGVLENDKESEKSAIKGIRDLLVPRTKKREYYFSPLSLTLSDYPDFHLGEITIKYPVTVKHKHPVELTVYRPFSKGTETKVYLGIDVGSTSTKAALVSETGKVIMGLYTYTLGQPMRATQALLEILYHEIDKQNANIRYLGVGTTGSGRKFIGKIIGADKAIDEISTHARAAYEQNPEVDTLIEIGGQDAKFTLVRNGNVIFSQMNTVCAAGTGSFIEEQANKLGVDLADYATLTEGASSPLASNRCTVFMERDINHYQNKGYTVPEILSAVVHSVRENYLQKVAVESAIGNSICFQGATARNKALVAAFEEKLQKPIYVSPYCHLTGAIGTALILKDDQVTISSFKGVEIFREEICFETETCSLCNNACKISVAQVKGEKVAWGFLCGREYRTGKYVNKNGSGFDLLAENKKIRRNTAIRKSRQRSRLTMGLPAGMHLYAEQPFWQDFFTQLGVQTLTGSEEKDNLFLGKRLAGAEFCAPFYALHGEVKWLAEHCDYVFLPHYLVSREKPEHSGGMFCYYSQYAATTLFQSSSSIRKKTLSPFLNFQKGEEGIIRQLYKMILSLRMDEIPLFAEVERAYQVAKEEDFKRTRKKKEVFTKALASAKDISVVFIGRPYIVLSNGMNKGIPDIFGAYGIRSFYMDMLPETDAVSKNIGRQMNVFPWYFASQISYAAERICETSGVYPVFLTAFKCSPDSFVLEYFKEYMDKKKKPYLILQVDEHDSNVGYETRIEAGIRSFRNHYHNGDNTVRFPEKLQVPEPIKDMGVRKTVLFPNWDEITCRLLTANLRRAGYDVRLLKMSEASVRRGMTTNTGCCIPLNIIVQDFVDYIRENALDPARVMLWLVKTNLSCNLPMFPYYARTLLTRYGNGMEKAMVYSGDFTHIEVSVNTTYNAYFAYMFGGYLRRLGNHLRPRENIRGSTDRKLKKAVDILEQAFLGTIPLEKALEQATNEFKSLSVTEKFIPKVAVFGDFFVRDNDIFNQQLTPLIEEAGGEVINTPYNEYVRLSSENVLRRMVSRGENLQALGFRALLRGIRWFEKKYYHYFEPFLGPEHPIQPIELEKNLKTYNIHRFLAGESYENILKIYYLMEKHPDISLFIQLNPAYCCPGLITESMKKTIEKEIGVPIITITYDGTQGDKNEIVNPYLKRAILHPGRYNVGKKSVGGEGRETKEMPQGFDSNQLFSKFRRKKWLQGNRVG